jgi:hypothetical protein
MGALYQGPDPLGLGGSGGSDSDDDSGGGGGDLWGTFTGALDHAAGSTDESVARQFDDESGGGIGDLVGMAFSPGKQEKLANELGADPDLDEGPDPQGGIGPLGQAITGVGGGGLALSKLGNLGNVGKKVSQTVDDVPKAKKFLGLGALGGVAVDDVMEGGIPNPFPPLGGGNKKKKPKNRNKNNPNKDNPSGGLNQQMLLIGAAVLVLLLVIKSGD